ncbi:MAG TPA: hypothetical protein PLR25_08400, partial [Planctomycetaceae bacterium]|nr:hypothetical protein [Planctomycetaceae bacterium]
GEAATRRLWGAGEARVRHLLQSTACLLVINHRPRGADGTGFWGLYFCDERRGNRLTERTKVVAIRLTRRQRF